MPTRNAGPKACLCVLVNSGHEPSSSATAANHCSKLSPGGGQQQEEGGGTPLEPTSSSSRLLLGRRLSSLSDESTPSTDEHGRRRSWTHMEMDEPVVRRTTAGPAAAAPDNGRWGSPSCAR